MKSKERFEKYRFFLTDLRDLIIKGENFSLRSLITENKMSDSARIALYSAEIIKKVGVGRGTQFEWLRGEVDNELVELLTAKIKEANRKNVSVRITKKKDTTKIKLLSFISNYFFSFTFIDGGGYYLFEFLARELNSEFCDNLKDFSAFSIDFSNGKIALKFYK